MSHIPVFATHLYFLFLSLHRSFSILPGTFYTSHLFTFLFKLPGGMLINCYPGEGNYHYLGVNIPLGVCNVALMGDSDM